MSFSPVRNVRISSLTPGARVQLRFGKAAVKSQDDTIAEVKMLAKYEEGEKQIVVFEETGPDGTSETRVSRYPRAPWMSEAKQKQYVSLIGVDESTYTIQKAATPIQTDAIGVAIKFVELEHEDTFGADQLIELFRYVQEGKRIPNEIKKLVIQLAVAVSNDIAKLPPKV